MDSAESSSHNPVGRKRRPSLPNPAPPTNPYICCCPEPPYASGTHGSKRKKRFVRHIIFLRCYLRYNMSCDLFHHLLLHIYEATTSRGKQTSQQPANEESSTSTSHTRNLDFVQNRKIPPTFQLTPKSFGMTTFTKNKTLPGLSFRNYISTLKPWRSPSFLQTLWCSVLV